MARYDSIIFHRFNNIQGYLKSSSAIDDASVFWGDIVFLHYCTYQGIILKLCEPHNSEELSSYR